MWRVLGRVDTASDSVRAREREKSEAYTLNPKPLGDEGASTHARTHTHTHTHTHTLIDHLSADSGVDARKPQPETQTRNRTRKDGATGAARCTRL